VYVHAFRQQAFAAALSAARECRPAAFGPHAGPETVLAFARSLGWLIGPFHKTATPSGSRALTVGVSPALSTTPQPNFALASKRFVMIKRTRTMWYSEQHCVDRNQASTQNLQDCQHSAFLK
jgi:hypothetical protein